MSKRSMGWAMAITIVTMAPTVVRATDYYVACDDFRMRFTPTGALNRIEDTTSTAGSGNPIVTTTSQSVIDGVGLGETWTYPIATDVNISGSTTTVEYIFARDEEDIPTKWVTVDITDHDHFLEFEVVNYGGDLHTIRLFGMFKDVLAFNLIQDYEAVELVDGANPGDRWYGGIVPLNAETSVGGSQYIDDNPAYSYDYLLVHSAATLPVAHPPYTRNQHWAFYVCHEDDIIDRLTEIEEEFDRPPLTAIKTNPANDLDYFFLTYEVDAYGNIVAPASKDIIDFCRATGLYSVLLVRNLWCDWTNADEYDHVWESGDAYGPGVDMADYIGDLKAAGLRIGLHVMYHHQYYTGYYATENPSDLTCSVVPPCSEYQTNSSRVCIYEGSDLPEVIGANFALRLEELGIDWVYVDGAGPLKWQEEDCEAVVVGGCGVFIYDDEFYRQDRIWDGMFAQLKADEYPLITFQAATQDQAHYDSRRGQVDYWDVHPGSGDTLLELIDKTVAFSQYCRTAGVIPDLGWFRGIPHSYTNPPPYTTCAEWEYYANAALTHNIPMGIQATYEEMTNAPLYQLIVPLLRETTRLRRHLGDYDDNGSVTSADRSNLVAALNTASSNHRIDFNLDGHIDQNDLDAFDAMFPSLPVSGTELPPVCVGRCCFRNAPCAVMTEADCIESCGQYAGNGTDCSGSCAGLTWTVRACCINNRCYNLIQCECEAQGGTWHPEYTNCNALRLAFGSCSNLP